MLSAKFLSDLAIGILRIAVLLIAIKYSIMFLGLLGDSIIAANIVKQPSRIIDNSIVIPGLTFLSVFIAYCISVIDSRESYWHESRMEENSCT